MSALSHPLTAVLDAAFDPFFLANSKGEILWQNSNAASLFGKPGSPAANLADAFGADVAGKILRTDRAQSFEVRSKNPALETVPFACYVMDCAPGTPGSATVLVACKSMLPDSTRMHQHEEYLAAVAHDLKNPLGALFGYADALLDTSIGVGLKEAVQPAASFFEMPAPKIQFSMPSTAAHDAKTKELENWSRAVFN